MSAGPIHPKLAAARQRLLDRERRRPSEWSLLLGQPLSPVDTRQEVLPMSDSKPSVPAVSEALSPSQAPRNPFQAETVWTPEAKAAMARAGIDVEKLQAPQVQDVTTVGLEDLCVEQTRYPKARQQSRPLVYLEHHVDPDGSDQPGYQGVLYAHIIDPQLGEVILTHGYARDTGELLPLSEFITTELTRGDVFLVADIETRKGRTVYRPIDPASWA